MNEEQELTILKILRYRLGGKCRSVCPANIDLPFPFEAWWRCSDCIGMFKDNPTYMESKAACPCVAVGEEAIVRLEERIQELEEAKGGKND